MVRKVWDASNAQMRPTMVVNDPLDHWLSRPNLFRNPSEEIDTRSEEKLDSRSTPELLSREFMEGEA